MRITETYSIEEAFKELNAFKRQIKESIRVENKKRKVEESMLDKLVDARNKLAGEKDEIREGEEICSNHGNKNAILEEDNVCPDCGKEVCECDKLDESLSGYEFEDVIKKYYGESEDVEEFIDNMINLADKDADLSDCIKFNSDTGALEISFNNRVSDEEMYSSILNAFKAVDPKIASTLYNLLSNPEAGKTYDKSTAIAKYSIKQSSTDDDVVETVISLYPISTNLEESVKEEPGEYEEAVKFAKTISEMDIDEAQALWNDFEFETHGPETKSEQVVYDALCKKLEKECD